MIKAQELRIGNRLIRRGITVTIDARSIFDIWNESDEYEPIPLSPELLVRCGFGRSSEPNSNNVWIKHVGLREFNIPSSFDVPLASLFYEVNRQGMIHKICDVQYLHQLQNIIYYITGTELTIAL